MQSQIVCRGCRTVLLYPQGAPSVCCAVCQAITTVPPPGLEMAQLICGGCRTLLMYTRNADTINTVATTLSATPASIGSSYSASSTSAPKSQPPNVTVVVENPMTVDEKGKLVSNVVVGVTTGRN
ncbi:hypothetical protein EJB05_05494 [Eragrostis curvula]|uniref:Zinc finger LSD1-type domain-containing protein n=1 Tax=Eragrostis curvula TaxID=38414 RepID=A0A5J9WFE3_9POAL|nr:hypothetical protein EJB05_05494 [Eragrostis curvula]